LDVAAHYLLQCATNNTDIKSWILEELAQKYPFNLGARGKWDQILRFAEADNEIRERTIHKIINDEMQHHEWEISVVLEHLKDMRLKQFAIKNVRTAEGFSLYWYLKPLIHGWASDDADVKQLKTEILHWPDNRLVEIINLLPALLPDRELCRNRLLMLAKENQNARNDLLVSAFAQLGCDATDDDVVDVLLAKEISTSSIIFNASGELIVNFAANKRVRAFTLDLLNQRSVPLAAIANAYEKDDEIRQKLLRQMYPLPT
jgi:hypothetical protein